MLGLNLLLLSGVFYLARANFAQAATLVDRLRGRILLQVEQRGEAWYVNPVDGKRYYLRDGNAAYQIMRQLGLGITDENLAQIPIAAANVQTYRNDQHGFEVSFPGTYAVANGTYGWPHAVVLIDEAEGSQSYSMQIEAWDTPDGYELNYAGRHPNGGVLQSFRSGKYISLNYNPESNVHDVDMEGIIRGFVMLR